MNEPLHLVADHISSVNLGHFQVLILINPKDLSIDTNKVYSYVGLIDHGDESHVCNRDVIITKIIDTTYNDVNCVKRVVQLYLSNVW